MMNKKIGVTGNAGKIGSRLVDMGATPLRCDITCPKEVEDSIRKVKPDVIIHAAAISSVDACEQNLENAILVNTRGANHVFEAAEDIIGAGKVVLLSSEQVFDGKEGAYKEADEPYPINDYGRTKYAAEGLAGLYDCKVIRLSRGISKQEIDISNILRKISKNEVPDVPDFIYRSYIHLDFLAQGIWEYANRFDEMPEILHYGGSKVLSFYQLVREIVGADAILKPRSKDNKPIAPRPHKCGFDISLARSLGLPIFSPEESVERLLNE